MRRVLMSMWVLGLGGVAGACGKSDGPAAPAAPAERDDAALTARAEAALGPFKKTLMGTLEEAMKQGPEAAISVCADVAPTLAEAASKPGARVGRTSIKLRNPKNRAPTWLAPELAGLVTPKLVTIDDTHVGYAEPIMLRAMCLTCHGKRVEPSLKDKLAARYPEDAATGYLEGEIRGAFWVELDTTTP